MSVTIQNASTAAYYLTYSRVGQSTAQARGATNLDGLSDDVQTRHAGKLAQAAEAQEKKLPKSLDPLRGTLIDLIA